VTVFPLRSKGEVPEVLIDWIRGTCRQLREIFGSDLPVLRLHSDRGGEFSSDLLRAFCRAEGVRQTFTLSLPHCLSPPLPLFLAPGTPPVDPLPPQGPAPSGVSQVDHAEPVEVAVDSGAARGAEPMGAGTGGAGTGGAEPERVELGGAESGVAESGHAEPGGAKPGRVEPEGTVSGAPLSTAAS
ncbi:unnamed protein product, partial [Closterium sp. NIES-54]